jgi:predicted nucleic acid-binding protein
MIAVDTNLLVHAHRADSPSHAPAVLRGLLERAGAAGVAGPAVHDARIAAICLEHGVAELWTSDRDFARFPDLRVRDPLIPALHEPPPAVYAAAGR